METDLIADGYLKNAMDKAKDVIKNDWDMVFLVDGYEGSGKSVMAQQLALYCDPSFNIDRIVFTPEEFKSAVVNAEKYTAIVYDEAYTGLSSRGTMSPVNRAIVTMLAEIRQKNLIIFIVMPSFFDLDRYVSIWRSRALIHCYTDGFQRGLFAFYNIDRKKDMYIMGKKTYSYKFPSPNFHGRFNNAYAVDKDAYKSKKLRALQEKEKKPETDKAALSMALFNLVQGYAKLKTHDDRIEFLNIPESTYYLKLKKWRLNNSLEDISGDLLGNLP